MDARKLFRSEQDKMLAGVCGGLGEYLGIDSTVLRLLWALWCLAGGMGIIAYLVAAVVIPRGEY